MTIQMKSPEQYFSAAMLTALNKVLIPFQSEDEILKWEHSNESY